MQVFVEPMLEKRRRVVAPEHKKRLMSQLAFNKKISNWTQLVLYSNQIIQKVT